MSECIVCKKELPDPWMVCMNCSTNRKDDCFKALEDLAKEMKEKKNGTN